MRHQRFDFKNLEQLKETITENELSIPIDGTGDFSILGEKVSIGERTISNRFVVHPMEGFDAEIDGSPSELTFRRYRKYAAGGSGLIWFEATSVTPGGRSNPGQVYISKENVEVYKKIVSEMRETAGKECGHEIVIILQITHSGRYSKPGGKPEPVIAHHSKYLDPTHNLPPDYPLISDDELDELQEKFLEAAKLAEYAGFDGVDTKACHRYLFSGLLASFTRENSKYGGSFENRTRMIRETQAKIRKQTENLIVTTRLNVYDAIPYPYGFGMNKNGTLEIDLTEPLELIETFKNDGVKVLNLSIGNPYYNPHFGRPYDKPVKGGKLPDEHPLVGISRLLEITKTIQKAQPEMAIIGTGYAWLRNYMPNVAVGVVKQGGATLIGQGRGAFAYPDSVNDILKGGEMKAEKCCVACSACTQIMRNGVGRTGCVIRDGEIYGPELQKGR